MLLGYYEDDRERKTMNFENSTALDLDNHPMLHCKSRTKEKYFQSLSLLVNHVTRTKYAQGILEQYWKILGLSDSVITENQEVLGYWNVLWRKKMRFILLCDLYLILITQKSDFGQAMSKWREKLNKKQFDQLSEVIQIIESNKEVEEKFSYLKEQILQIRKNIEFQKKPLRTIFITATMSAGKSTLINALIGKPLMNISQVACTSHINYLFNKPFEDDKIAVETDNLDFDISLTNLKAAERDKSLIISSYFRKSSKKNSRLCIIDSPGVNSATNRDHQKITKRALLEGDYDEVICVLDATNLGVEDAQNHLLWLSKNVPKDKVVFVVNKFDRFNQNEDSIPESLEQVIKDLIELGYKNPKVFPISAYYAFLAKQNEYEGLSDEDDKDEYYRLTKKLKKESYNLNFDKVEVNASYANSGLTALEKYLENREIL